MSRRDVLLRAAEALEKIAVEQDAVEGTKVAAVAKEREEVVADLARRIEESTGEVLSDAERAKLASSDEDTVALLKKFTAAGDGTSLGTSARHKEAADEDVSHLSKAERIKRAHERFGNYLTSPSNE